MIAEAVLTAADALRHGTTGVNALLASVPKEAGWSVPPAVTIADSLTMPWVTRGVIDWDALRAGPILLVGTASELQLSRPEQNDRVPIEVAVRYAVRGTDQRTLAALMQFASVTLRAATRALMIGWRETDWLQRNKVDLEPPGIRWLEMLDPRDSDVLASALVVTYPATDSWALGTL